MSIFSGIGKAFKRVFKSPVAKIALGAAAAYVGGAAFGLWDSPFESINGVFSGASDAISGGEGVSSLVGGGADELLSSPADSVGPNAMEMGAMPGVLGSAGSAGLINSATPVVPEIGKGATSVSGMSSGNILGDVGKWIQQNPIPALIAGNMLAGAFTPNAADIEKQRSQSQMELEDWRRKYAGQNTNVSGVKLGMAPSGKPLTAVDPSRGGLINGRI